MGSQKAASSNRMKDSPPRPQGHQGFTKKRSFLFFNLVNLGALGALVV
jgi:hypothetical protein